MKKLHDEPAIAGIGKLFVYPMKPENSVAKTA
jgi:hypothetical protein